MNRQAFVYALSNPVTKVVHYVGCSIHPYERLKQHYAESQLKIHAETFGWTPPSPKNSWVGQLVKQGLQPGITILERCDFEQGKFREDFWIEHYLIMGCRLVNTRRFNKRWALNQDYYEKNWKAQDAVAIHRERGRPARRKYKFIPFEL